MNTIPQAKTAQSSEIIRNWLYGLAALIILMVMVGGATRLTDSGLSITEWAPIRGFLPPLSPEHWMAEFAAYQTTDEYKFQNSSMTLEQFKHIYWWEWGHRFLGRLIGLAILLPLIYFWATGKLNDRLKISLLFLFVLICFQGFLGWWMVKSGLAGRVDVSQIRLAVHLVAACVLLACVVWIARSLADHTEPEASRGYGQAGFLVLLILFQIFIGGLVAGLDAGLVYNTWPKMNGNWLPDSMWAASPAWTNLTDNAGTVQFFHRMSAYFLLVCAICHGFYMTSRLSGTTHARRAWLLVLLIILQAMIGIVTLLIFVPLSWALFHQFGGIIVLIFAVAHWRALRPYGQTPSSTILVIDRENEPA